uniref:Uncharacterized protein n=1 Tax=Ignisphaera aggregans TaxID=334771 RepID=A0A7J3Z7L8_9CREN
MCKSTALVVIKVQRHLLSFVLILSGGALLVFQGLLILMARTLAAILMLHRIALTRIALTFASFAGVFSLVLGVLMIIGATLIYSGENDRLFTGSLIALIASILSILVGGGLVVGFVLGLAGGILGLVEV